MRDGTDRGRDGQRRRTRKAIVEGAMELLAAGASPSVAEVAEAADVSRRTVYMYFPTLEHLLADAAVGLVARSGIDRDLDPDALPEDPEDRVEAMARALQRRFFETEALGRTIIRATIDSPSDGASPKRGYRRIAWIETAVAPLREQLDEERFERLVSGLAMIIGWEAMIVLRDIRGLSEEQGWDVAAWAARALVRAALADQNDPPG